MQLAVTASVRHVDTDYDELLMSGIEGEEARHQMRERVEEVLRDWSATAR